MNTQRVEWEFDLAGAETALTTVAPNELGEMGSVEHVIGTKQYELSNHLGNVLAVISDIKVPVASGTVVSYYESVVISSQDYSPFGVTLSGRSWSEGYRYGFNGQEKEKDITGSDTHTSAEFWMYDTRVGRRWDIDPMYDSFSFLSPYSTFALNPITLNDTYGLSPGDPVKVQIEGEKNAQTVSDIQGSLPAQADDQQQIIFEFTQGQVKSITYTFSSNKGWMSSTIVTGEAGQDIVMSGGRFVQGNSNITTDDFSSRYAVNFETANAIIETHNESSVRSKHKVSKRQTQPKNTKNVQIARIGKIQKNLDFFTSTAGLAANITETVAKSAADPSQYKYGAPTTGEVDRLTKWAKRANWAGKFFGVVSILNNASQAIMKAKEGDWKGAVWSGIKAGADIGFTFFTKANPLTLSLSLGWALFSAD